MSENDLITPGGKLRLYVDVPLGKAARVVPDEQQAHYLLHVMRAKSDDRITLFNGRDGEWLARVTDISKRSCLLECERNAAPQAEVPDVWLCFAPIKKTPADYVVQKATELGVRVLQPVITQRTIVRRVNPDRMRANAIEAAEQSGRVSVPEVREPLTFDKWFAAWPSERCMLFCDESGSGRPIYDVLTKGAAGPPAFPWGIITGPEGGFTPEEAETLRHHSYSVPVSLGPRILRADTAALAALSIWQAMKGDWLNPLTA